jgi:murein DD-endopeptidase MepM/ murein hydrolase activator NlpD
MKSVFKPMGWTVLAVAIIAGLVLGYLKFFESSIPEVHLTPDSPYVTETTQFVIKASDTGTGLEMVQVAVQQQERQSIVLSQSFSAGQHDWSATFNFKNAKLQEGPFELLISCTDKSWSHLGKGNTRLVKQNRELDNHPPVVSVISRQHNVAVGGCGMVVYTLSEPSRKTGIMIGKRFFPGFKQGSSENYLSLFTFPYDADPDKDVPEVIAVDHAGNTGRCGFNYHLIPKQFRQDTISISDRFLEQKMPQFTTAYPNEATLLDVFLKVNNESRTKNRASLHDFARQTAPEILWNKTFIRQPGAATRATFGDKRTYTYNGQVIDRQRHLGVDLASIARDKVQACNSGNVVFDGFMGIYGNVIIIDHGMGLQSLYAHLSQILAHKGDRIKRGQIIGLTGATGMAGGDHLHLGIIVSGIPVNPIEWWDDHWIRDNIDAKRELLRQLSQSPASSEVTP